VSDPDPVPSEAFEQAVSDVRLIHRDYRTALSTARQRPVGRFNAERSATSNRATHLAIAAIVAIVEHYAEVVLLDAGHDAKTLRDWKAKETAWQSAFGVDLRTSCSHFVAMIGFYEARTAVMHARGSLTDAQRRTPRREAVDDALKSAGIQRHRRELILTPRVAANCASVCCAALREMEDSRRGTS